MVVKWAPDQWEGARRRSESPLRGLGSPAVEGSRATRLARRRSCSLDAVRGADVCRGASKL